MPTCRVKGCNRRPEEVLNIQIVPGLRGSAALCRACFAAITTGQRPRHGGEEPKKGQHAPVITLDRLTFALKED